MCPRIAYAKMRPGDLVWCCISDGVQLYRDRLSGGNVDKDVVVCIAPYRVPCMLLAMDGDTGTIMVLAPSGRFGWSYRLMWEKAGEEKQEWET